MRYRSFRIRNFKGIKDTTVRFDSVAGASVFAFVGLNESGKTTVLEAIHSFSPDAATSQLLGGEKGIGVPISERVPRHLISEFTGAVSVEATLSITPSDKTYIAELLLADHKLVVCVGTFPDEVIFRREQHFRNGDLESKTFTLLNTFHIRNERARKWRQPTEEEHHLIHNALYSCTPDIAYFPTFVFDFPDRIFLSERGGVVHQFYRSVFQDILNYDGRGHTIEKDILNRVRRKEMIIPWLTFLATWGDHDDKAKVQHVMDRAGAAVTNLVFGRWNKIFGEDTRGKEIVITYELVEGEKLDSRGSFTKTQEHDISIKFQIRDGTRRFDVNDRSLGFRWFFSFMLFTQFRVAGSSADARPLLFLFDEPASNLHAAAQQRLIESFPEIAKKEHILAYSTHSHYMIEPKWLEQTFIVRNRADDPTASVLDQVSLDDESLDVQVETYRSFVNKHPGQTTYFQPILDRLEVVPSRFDMQKASIVVEGKSDYYVIRYLQNLFQLGDIPLLPGLGAGTFGALASLHVGWNLNFLFVLDGDKQGKIEMERYAEEFGVSKRRLATIADLVPGVTIIEDLLDAEARDVVQHALCLTTSPSKAQIRRFFQERLASGQLVALGAKFEANARTLHNAVRTRLAEG